jgi:toxin-antitoxin system PIN domain toxin
LILADVNVLLKAFRTDAAGHDQCRSWLQETIRSDSAFGVAHIVLSSVIRIATNRRAYDPPSTVSEAVAFCNELLAQPHCIVVDAGPRHWSIFTRLCVEADIKGAMVTDAWLAALAIEHGCEWITLDRDFKRFPGLRWRAPG